MRVWRLFISALLSSLWMLILFAAASGKSQPSAAGETAGSQIFLAKGVVQSINRAEQRIVIQHEAISNYMGAMTMPFKVKTAGVLAGLQDGDEISFQLHVTETESWVDQIVKAGTSAVPVKTPTNVELATAVAALPAHPLLYYKFTNELGQAVSLNDFRGQALAVTFFYTRCPLPDYCPRLSKNFQEASQKLESMAVAPTNWHCLSISFDTEFDSPDMLKAYGESYQYDPNHWSFLTGPPDKIGELARACGMSYQRDGNTFNHDFRTLIIDAAGHLQMIFPTTGDLSDQIVAELVKAAAVTNRPVAQLQNQ
jgi:protein SCO1